MSSRESAFQSVRVLLDARLPADAMIVVSSACEGDGQAELAHGLALAFGDAGRRTALISLFDGSDRGPSSRRDGGVTKAAGSYLQASIAPNELDAVVAEMRSKHDVVIVASPPIVTMSAALQLCRLADGVLLAVRLGRKIMMADETTVDQLQRVGAIVLGVIAMRSGAAKGGARRDVLVTATPALEAVSN